MKKAKMARWKEALLWLAILVGPFATTLWTYRYWERIRDHLMWVGGDEVASPGHDSLAALIVVVVYTVLVGRILDRWIRQ